MAGVLGWVSLFAAKQLDDDDTATAFSERMMLEAVSKLSSVVAKEAPAIVSSSRLLAVACATRKQVEESEKLDKWNTIAGRGNKK